MQTGLWGSGEGGDGFLASLLHLVAQRKGGGGSARYQRDETEGAQGGVNGFQARQ
jgi:hypothetical protein